MMRLTLPPSARLLPILALLAIAAPPASKADGDRPSPRWQKESDRQTALTKGLVWFNWEGLTYLTRRNEDYISGEFPQEFGALYDQQTDPDNIAKLAAAGVINPGNIHFHKGFGLETEKEDIEKTIAGAKAAHEHGMMVSVYIGGTMCVETFDQEVPEAKNWEARDAFGRPIPYTPTQTWRHYPSLNEPAYRDYLKRVLKKAVEEAHADEIYFDNNLLEGEPLSDHSPQAERDFKAFLRRRYPTREAALRRFGVADAGLLRAPEWDDPAAPRTVKTIDDPVLQEWVRFRCESVAHYCGDLYDYIKGLNPKVSVAFNIKGVYPENRLWSSGIYHPFFKNHCDFVSFDTGGYECRIDRASGALIGQFRAYLWARRLGLSFIDDKIQTSGDPVSGIPNAFIPKDEYRTEAEADLSTATYMSFGYQKDIPGGFSPGGPNEIWVSNILTPTMQFFRHYNNRYYTHTDLVADVAILRTFPSLAYTINANYVPLSLTEQVLIQHKVPTEEISEDDLADLGHYRALILAGEDALSQEVVDRLLAYVRAGGCVIAAPDSGSLDENRRRRAQPPFARARAEGQGRILALPDPLPARSPAAPAGAKNRDITDPNHAIQSPFLTLQMLPKNHEAIAQVVLSGIGRPPSVETGAPLTTVLTLLHRPESKETILHLVNYENHASGTSYSVSLQAGWSGPIKSVQLFSPDRDDPLDVTFKADNGRVSFEVPGPRVYSMIVVSQN